MKIHALVAQHQSARVPARDGGVTPRPAHHFLCEKGGMKMANEQNLVPGAHPLTVEEASRGGVNSGKARREKRDRHKRIQELFAMTVKDPKLKIYLEKLGVDATDADLEAVADARVLAELLRKGDYKAWQAMKEEAYGKLDNKTSLEVSGEIEGITINVVDYSKEK